MQASDDLLSAAAEYGRAQSELLQSRVELVKNEARLSLLRLAAATLAAVAAIVLLATAWVLLNVALAQWVAAVSDLRGIGFLTVAGFNVLVAAGMYAFMRHNLTLLSKTRFLSGAEA